MRNYLSCPYFLPWITTSHGERNNMCVCERLRFSKECDECINVDKPKSYWCQEEIDIWKEVKEHTKQKRIKNEEDTIF